jgi:tripartite-type tricarboxylate transporter receptor subunit TctC
VRRLNVGQERNCIAWRRIIALLLTLLVCVSRPAMADDYPIGPIKLVVGAAAGGGFDLIARLLGDAVSAKLKQPVIVENRPGAGHVVATEVVARSEPDGYTLLVAGANHVLNPMLHSTLPYDSEADFVPVALWARTPFILEVNASIPAKTVQELVGYVKAKGTVTFTSSQLNSSSHVAGELFKQMGGLEMTYVPYRGSAPALQDLLANRVSIMVDAPVSSMPFIAQGALRALAVTSPERFAGLPDVPTMAESGFPGFSIVAWVGLMAPAKTPPSVIAKLNGAFNDALRDPEVLTVLARQGWEAAPRSPAEFRGFLQAEIASQREVVRKANMHE